jgi:hypothetical protein
VSKSLQIQFTAKTGSNAVTNIKMELNDGFLSKRIHQGENVTENTHFYSAV